MGAHCVDRSQDGRKVRGRAWRRCGLPVLGFLAVWVALGAAVTQAASPLRLIKDIRLGATGSQPHGLTACKGRVFFSADDGMHGRELWVTDGTAEGTRLVRDINTQLGFPPPGSDPEQLTAAGDLLLFLADDGVNGKELWCTDGTAGGTRLVKEIAVGPASTSTWLSWPGNTPPLFTAMGGLVFFSVTPPENTPGRAALQGLWRSDGTDAGTFKLMDLFDLTMPSECGYSRNEDTFSALLPWRQQLFFGAEYGPAAYMKHVLVPGGYQCEWGDAPRKVMLTSDGTAAGTGVRKSYGSEQSLLGYSDFQPFLPLLAGEQGVYFALGSRDSYYLQWTDGEYFRTVDGVWAGIGAEFLRVSRAPAGIREFDGNLFFVGTLVGDVGCVWKYESATGQLTEFIDVRDEHPTQGPALRWFGEFLFERQGRLYFTAADYAGDGRLALWRTDGTRAGIQLVTRQITGGFIAREGTEHVFAQGLGLWASNGTEEGTRPLHGFELGGVPAECSAVLDPSGVLVLAGSTTAVIDPQHDPVPEWILNELFALEPESAAVTWNPKVAVQPKMIVVQPGTGSVWGLKVWNDGGGTLEYVVQVEEPTDGVRIRGDHVYLTSAEGVSTGEAAPFEIYVDSSQFPAPRGEASIRVYEKSKPEDHVVVPVVVYPEVPPAPVITSVPFDAGKSVVDRWRPDGSDEYEFSLPADGFLVMAPKLASPVTLQELTASVFIDDDTVFENGVFWLETEPRSYQGHDGKALRATLGNAPRGEELYLGVHVRDVAGREAHRYVPEPVAVRGPDHYRSIPCLDNVPVRNAARSVCRLSYKVTGISGEGVSGYGTGFLVHKAGLVLTALHVLEEADLTKEKWVEFGVEADSASCQLHLPLDDPHRDDPPNLKRYDFEVIEKYRDPGSDWAIVRLLGWDRDPAIPVAGFSTERDVGDVTYLVGHPQGQAMQHAVGAVDRIAPSAEAAAALRKKERDPEAFFSITSQGRPGNSGGPIFNRDGAVIGIASTVRWPDLQVWGCIKPSSLLLWCIGHGFDPDSDVMSVNGGGAYITGSTTQMADLTAEVTAQPPKPVPSTWQVLISYRFGPDGQVFDPPLELRIPRPTGLENPGAQGVVLAETAEGWEELPTTFFEGSPATTEDDYWMTEIRHFSAFVFAKRQGVVLLDPRLWLGPIGSRTFGDPPFSLNATSLSSSPILFSVISGPAVVNGSLLTLTGVGVVTVRARQEANAEYQSALVEQTFDVLAPLVAPSFTLEPGDATVVAGETARFEAEVAGTPSPTLQWERSVDGGETWQAVANGGGVAGATQPTLVITETRFAFNGERFRLRASNAAGVMTSRGAVLTVLSEYGPITSTDVGWVGVSIGSTPGSTVDRGEGGYDVVANGRDVWDEMDGFRFLWHSARGDFDMTVRVQSLGRSHEWAKAGLMARASLDPGSPHVSVFVTPATGVNQTVVQQRETTDGASVTVASGGPPSYPNAWLRLTRTHGTLMAFWSVDGLKWRHVGSSALVLPDRLQVGMAVSAHNSGNWALTTGAEFREFSVQEGTGLRLQPAVPAGLWAVENALTDQGVLQIEQAPSVTGPWTALADGGLLSASDRQAQLPAPGSSLSMWFYRLQWLPGWQADSEADFSTVQGDGGWQYGYYDRPRFPSEFRFTPFPAYSTQNNAWWLGSDYWLRLGSNLASPHRDYRGDYWVVRRLTCPIRGQFHLTGRIMDYDPLPGTADGVVLHLLVNSAQRLEVSVAEAQTRDFATDLELRAGDTVDFAIEARNTDWTDSTGFWATLRKVD